jgi:hypothetical protein
MSITREEIRQLCIAHDRFMSEVEQKRWREWRKLVEAELMRIAKLGPS